MLEDIGEIKYQDCNGRYRRVRGAVEQATSEMAQQERIFQRLFKSGGRCDCTVDRNILRVEDTRMVVEQDIAGILMKG